MSEIPSEAFVVRRSLGHPTFRPLWFRYRTIMSPIRKGNYHGSFLHTTAHTTGSSWAMMDRKPRPPEAPTDLDHVGVPKPNYRFATIFTTLIM